MLPDLPRLPARKGGEASPEGGSVRAFGVRRRVAGVLVFATLVSYGVGLRLWDLADLPLWSDEAESCVNALTIVGQGVPADRYQGMPLFENVLSKPWPESGEYEFRDSSYSSKGLTIYHGWLPLYAMAFSFRAGGVGPDAPPDAVEGPLVRHSAEEVRRRTWLGRAPGVAFGGLFLVALFAAGRAMYGPDAGWVALAAGAVCKPAVEFAREARYYSATLALTVCCCLATWQLYRRGRWRDVVFAAVCLGLLFHTHVLSFLVAALMVAPALLSAFRHQGVRAAPKVLTFGAIVGAAAIPWLLWTDFLNASSGVPAARSLLGVRGMLTYPLKQWPVTLAFAAAVVFLLAAPRLRARWASAGGRRSAFVGVVVEHRAALLFLATWTLLGFLAFVLLMPAASYFSRRMTLAVMGPGLLFVTLFCCTLAHAVTGGKRVNAGAERPPHPAAVALALLFVIGGLAAVGQTRLAWAAPPVGRETTYDVVEALRGWPMRPGTRLYATPNEHHVLTLYTGRPVQSIAPVRKSFLDAYPGDIIVLESGPRYEPLPRDEVRRLARSAGRELSEAEAADVRLRLPGYMLREDLRPRVADVQPDLPPPPEWLATMIDDARDHSRREVARKVALSLNPLLNGYELPDHSHWWQVFFYRFVGVEGRSGEHLNYAARCRGGRAYVLPAEWVLLHAPGPAPAR